MFRIRKNIHWFIEHRRIREKEECPVPGVGDKVGLELGEVHVESTVEPEGGRDGGHDLA
jgi:hypothetical protein